MNTTRRILLVLVFAAMIAAYLLGSASVTQQAGAQIEPERPALTNAQWAAIRAAYLSLMSEQNYAVFLPMALKE